MSISDLQIEILKQAMVDELKEMGIEVEKYGSARNLCGKVRKRKGLVTLRDGEYSSRGTRSVPYVRYMGHGNHAYISPKVAKLCGITRRPRTVD